MKQPVLIAKEFVPSVLQLVGQDVEALVDVFLVGQDSYLRVVQDLCNGKRQLWILTKEHNMEIQGWMVTKIHRTATGKRLVYDLLGGEDLELMLSHCDVFETWARQFGVDETMAFVRPGLRKKLKKFCFHHVCDLVVRPLDKRVH